jgi:hypothetical protein
MTFRSSSQDGYPENHRGLKGSVGASPAGPALLVMRLLRNFAYHGWRREKGKPAPARPVS